MMERDDYETQHLGNYTRAFPSNDYVMKTTLELTFRIQDLQHKYDLLLQHSIELWDEQNGTRQSKDQSYLPSFKRQVEINNRTSTFVNNKAKAFDLLTSFPQSSASDNTTTTDQTKNRPTKPDEQNATNMIRVS